MGLEERDWRLFLNMLILPVIGLFKSLPRAGSSLITAGIEGFSP